MEEGQTPSASSAHNSRGPNVSSNQAITYFFGAPQAPAAAAAAITPRALAEPPAAAVGAAGAAAAPTPAPAEAPLAAPPQQQCSHSAC